MREKLETLPLPELRAIAKAKGMKKIIPWIFCADQKNNRIIEFQIFPNAVS